MSAAESHARLSADLATHSSSLFKKIGEVENQEAQAKREIRNDLLQQSKELTDAIRTKGEELVALLERRSQELQHAEDRSRGAGQPVLRGFAAADRSVQGYGRRLAAFLRIMPTDGAAKRPASDDQPLAELRAILLGPDREAWETMRQRLDNPSAAR